MPAHARTGSTLRHIKRVKIVGVPTPEQVGLYDARPAFLRPASQCYDTAPCARCQSVCCQEKVCINVLDLARLVIALGVPPAQLVNLDTVHQSTLTRPATIAGQPTHMLLQQVQVPGLPSPACHMLARPGGLLRCGVHGVRPGICRAYPFEFDTERGQRFAVGRPILCPARWSLTTVARRAQEREILNWRRENDAAERSVARWNRHHGTENASAFLRFAVEEGAAALGLDGRRYLHLERPPSSPRVRLW